MQTAVSTVRVLVTLMVLLLIPGWAAMLVGDLWRRWSGLQRWIVAVGLSIAFYPVFFYTVRWVMPFLTLGPYKMGAMLTAMGVWIGRRMRGKWRVWFAFDELEWAALAVFGMTLFTRFWVLRDHPYPAWTDSLHHTLLTQLTAVQGQLPRTMEPYFPIPLGQYHLGLYAITAATQWLAQVPAHTALLWTAQALNGLCGLGVYLVLDRRAGRPGALVGATVVGLLSHQPAWYVNWGRFTQVAGQAILLIAWEVTRETLESWGEWRGKGWGVRSWYALCAAALTAAVALLHFRVGAFYLLLLATSTVWDGWLRWRKGRMRRFVEGVMVVGVLALVLAGPAMRAGVLTARRAAALNAQGVLTEAERGEVREHYFQFPMETVPILVARSWLLVLGGLGALIGIAGRESLVGIILAWVAELVGLGNAYRLGIPALSLTNMGAILIMLYLPLGIVVGAASERVAAFARYLGYAIPRIVVVTICLTVGFVGSHVRVTEIEPYRYYVTPADLAAMQWINAHVPGNAVFAVNTHFWLPRAPHGTDGGYWIPYFTGRRTTAGTMLDGLGSEAYLDKVVAMSRAVKRLEAGEDALEELRRLGVTHIYVGAKGNFASPPGLDVTRLRGMGGVEVVYEGEGVAIFSIGGKG